MSQPSIIKFYFAFIFLSKKKKKEKKKNFSLNFFLFELFPRANRDFELRNEPTCSR